MIRTTQLLPGLKSLLWAKAAITSGAHQVTSNASSGHTDRAGESVLLYRGNSKSMHQQQ